MTLASTMTIPHLARWAGAALGLASLMLGCGDSNGERTGVDTSAVTSLTGVDYSWYRPSPSNLASQGYKFVVRYSSYDTTGKNLSKSEADALIAAGLDIVSNWENGSQRRPLRVQPRRLRRAGGRAAGRRRRRARGPPHLLQRRLRRDACAADGHRLRTSTASRRSSASARTGAYGGYYVIQRLFDAGKIKWGWQTYAWSGGQWDSRAQLRQVQNGIAGGQMDEDTSEADDFGQWGHGTPAPPDQPKGYLDQATCAAVAGWAQDPQVPTTSIFTDVYYDGAAGAAGAVGLRLTASISRPDLCTAIGSCDHGFSMSAPRSLLDGHAHDVYAYGIDHTAGGLNTLLTNSPKSFTCAAPAIAAGTVKRHVTSPTILSDWRFDTFTDMAPYTTAEIAAVPDGADLGSAPKIVQVTGDPAVYVADETYRRHIVNPDSLAAWRLTGADVKAVTAADLAALTAGPDWPLAPLLAKDPADPAVYMLDVPFPEAGGDGGASPADGGSVAADAGGVEEGGVASPHPDAGAWPFDDGGANDASAGSSGGCAVARGAAPEGNAWLVIAAIALSFTATRRRLGAQR